MTVGRAKLDISDYKQNLKIHLETVDLQKNPTKGYSQKGPRISKIPYCVSTQCETSPDRKQIMQLF